MEDKQQISFKLHKEIEDEHISKLIKQIFDDLEKEANEYKEDYDEHNNKETWAIYTNLSMIIKKLKQKYGVKE